MAVSDAVRLPRALRGETRNGALLERGRLRPIALAVSLSLEPLSTADMVLAEDDLPLAIHDFVELYGADGSLGVFRAVNIVTDYRRQRRVRLNHALDTLNDALIPGEEPIAGTVRQVLERILAAQTAAVGGTACWRLGTVDDPRAYTLDNQDDNALDCLKKLARDEDDYYFAFDFSAFPWTLHFLAREQTVGTEFRLSRNVESCQVTLDDGELCTRLLLSVDADDPDAARREVYDDAAAQAAWGVVCKTESVKSADVPDRPGWARAYFARHAQPAAQITIDGLELHRLTGETLDRMRLGRLCRVALPEYQTWLRERVVALSYPDLLRQPQRVTVSLVNKRMSAGSAVSRLSSRTIANERAVSRSEKEIEKIRYSWRATDQHVTDMGTILHAAGLEIDPHGVWLYASEDGPNYALGASFKVQADNITAEVNRATAAEGSLSASITAQAGRIDLKADASEVTALGSRVSSAEVAIDGANAQIALKASQTTVDALGARVSQAEIDIDGAESAIALKANTVTVQGIETNLNAVTTKVNSLIAGSSTFSLVNAQSIRLAGYSLYLANGYVRYGLGD